MGGFPERKGARGVCGGSSRLFLGPLIALARQPTGAQATNRVHSRSTEERKQNLSLSHRSASRGTRGRANQAGVDRLEGPRRVASEESAEQNWMGGKPSAPFPLDGVPWCEPDPVTRDGASPPLVSSRRRGAFLDSDGLAQTQSGKRRLSFPDTLTKRPWWANAESDPRLLIGQDEISLGRA